MPDTAQDSSPQPSPAIADLAPPAEDKSVSGLVSSLTNLDRKKVAEDTRILNQSDSDQAKDKAAREKAFASEGVAASELPKSWDADKEHKKWESNPLEGFGSAGGLFAMVASAFTKAPMENAINGMAGAINSIKEGNEKGYERAFGAYKENVKLAEQRFKTQHELYSDALALGTADAAASSAKLHNAAVRFGDSQMLMLAEHGMIKEIYELQAARASSMEQMTKAADAIDLHTVQKAAVDAIKKNPPQTGDPVQDKMMLAAQIQRIYDGGGKYGSAEQEAVGRFMQANMKKSPQEIADGLAEIHQQFSAKAPNIEGYQSAKTSWAEQHPGETMPADEDAKLLQQFGLTAAPRGGAAGAGGDPHSGPQLKIAQIKEIQAEGKAEGKWQSLNEAENEWKKRQSQPSMPPEEIKKFGEQLASGDTSVLTNIGRGAQSAANVMAIRKAAYDIIEERGGKPADLAMLNARYQGLKAAERASATQEMKMGAAAWEASNQADLALSLSDKLPRSRIVPFNAAVQKFEEKTSDPDMNSFASANNTFVNSYVRAISPTGISTDLVRKHAYDMLNTALSEEAYRKVVGVLKQEMRLAVVSPGQMLKQMEAEYKHNADPASPAPPGMTTTTNPLNDTSKVIKYDKDGNRVQ
jgi:hypothetical protein